MKPPSGTGPPGRAVQRAFEGNRLAGDSQARAYQKVLPVAAECEIRTGVRGEISGHQEESRVSQEGVAA
jgi:hypothetical protein